MLKKKFIIFLFLFVSSCGYEAIHSKKNSINYNFSINKINFIGDRDLNLQIKRKLNNYTLRQKGKIFSLNISTTTEKITLAKDTTGDATSFNSIIIVNVEVLNDGDFKGRFKIKEQFTYNNNTDKFELKRYEREILNNLSETATEILIFKLSNIK